MSDSNNKLHLRAVYLRNLLIAYVTGRNVNESDYHKLRHYFMGHPKTGNIVPELVAAHADLPALWHSMRYDYASHEDRKAHVLEQFQVFLDQIEPKNNEKSTLSGSGYPLIDEKKIHEVWSSSSVLMAKSPDVAVQQMISLVENLCFQLLKHLKVVPDPQQHSLTPLVKLTGRSLLLSPGKKYHVVVNQLITGCGETLAAIDSFTVDRAHINNQTSDEDGAASFILISLYGSLSSMLLAGWKVHEMLKEGSMQR